MRVLEPLAAGVKPEEIAEDYMITVKDEKATLLYAAKTPTREEVIIETPS